MSTVLRKLRDLPALRLEFAERKGFVNDLQSELPTAVPAHAIWHRQMTLTVSVVICIFTERRWDDIIAAVDSIQNQCRQPAELIIVVDHNDELFQRARNFFGDVMVVASRGARGLSGARNTGVQLASGDVVVFLDDDARARQEWLERLLAPYADQAVQGVGGLVVADWPTDRPGWFPPEFDWVVGCSYAGMPTAREQVRNPIGAAMSVRKSAFTRTGGFTEGVGRVSADTSGCDETEFFIRLRRVLPAAKIMYEPMAVVEHRVTTERVSFAYFRRRCYAEGTSTALVAHLVGTQVALAAERRYVRHTLPRAIAGNLRSVDRWPRAGALVLGFIITSTGYLVRRSNFVVSAVMAG